MGDQAEAEVEQGRLAEGRVIFVALAFRPFESAEHDLPRAVVDGGEGSVLVGQLAGALEQGGRGEQCGGHGHAPAPTTVVRGGQLALEGVVEQLVADRAQEAEDRLLLAAAQNALLGNG